jgi:hypothetical protein
VVRVYEDVGEVVVGLRTLFIVIDTVDPFMRAAALIFTRKDVELKSTQVDETLTTHELALVDAISTGRVTMIFELAIRLLIVVKVKVWLEVAPIEELVAVTTPPKMSEVAKV